VALVTSGITVATVVGVPLGSLIGNQFGWRATFALVAVLGAIALAGLLFGLPRGLPRTTATIAQRLAVARHGAVLYALTTTMLWAVGGFTVFTYLSVPLRNVGFDASDISLALLVFGSAAAIGNMLGGTLADRLGPMPTAALGLAGMAVALTLESPTLKFATPEKSSPQTLVIYSWNSLIALSTFLKWRTSSLAISWIAEGSGVWMPSFVHPSKASCSVNAAAAWQALRICRPFQRVALPSFWAKWFLANFKIWSSSICNVPRLRFPSFLRLVDQIFIDCSNSRGG